MKECALVNSPQRLQIHTFAHLVKLLFVLCSILCLCVCVCSYVYIYRIVD